MTAPVLHRYADAAAMTAALGQEIVDRLAAEVARSGVASLVCAGGSTPGDLYEALSCRSAPWDAVQVVASDERWVPSHHAASNERLLRSRLLTNLAAGAAYVSLRTDDLEPDEAEAAADAAVAAMPRPFTVTLLGMGADGHTASLFPGAKGLEAALDLSEPALARAVHAPSAAGSNRRMTLTARALLDSRIILLAIRGPEKLAAYEAALAGDDVLAAPVRAVLKQGRTPVAVHWSP